MERILLTPKEVGKIIEDIPNEEWNPLNLVNSIAQAQLKNMVGWLAKECKEHTQHTLCEGHPYYVIRRNCSECWQALLKEVGLEE